MVLTPFAAFALSHRVHHGLNPRDIDRNHGGTPIIRDKRFGTFEPENPADPVRFGLTKNIARYVSGIPAGGTSPVRVGPFGARQPTSRSVPGSSRAVPFICRNGIQPS